MLDSDLEGSDDGDEMPETEDDGQDANLDVGDERKRLQAVLAQFDGGAAVASQAMSQQATKVRPRLSRHPLQGICTSCLPQLDVVTCLKTHIKELLQKLTY